MTHLRSSLPLSRIQALGIYAFFLVFLTSISPLYAGMLPPPFVYIDNADYPGWMVNGKNVLFGQDGAFLGNLSVGSEPPVFVP